MCAARRPSVGLDFGTTTTLVASTRAVVPINNEGTFPWMPSLVGYTDDGSVVVGERAQVLPHGQLVRSIKRAITDERYFVSVEGPAGRMEVPVDDLITELLREAGRRGAHKGQDVGAGSLVRLGCPAAWNGDQRRRLLRAAQRADLPVVLATMVDEPVAAGIAWLSRQNLDADSALRLLVFDMGGGTLDIAVLDVRGKDVAVLSAFGIGEAGDALDEAIATDLDFELAKMGIDIDALPRPQRARAWLRDQARTAKLLLSVDEEHPIVLDPRVVGRTGEVWYTRQRLEAVFTPQMERAEAAVGMALVIARLAEASGSGQSASDLARMGLGPLVRGIDIVILSGGMCRTPYVKQRLEWLFEESTKVELADEAPENAVAVGLARAGAFGRINMFRPGFDVVLEWDKGAEFRTLYEAFTPLVERDQIAKGSADLRRHRTGRALSLPNGGRGKLRVVSYSGERLRASLGERSLDGFPVSLNGDDFEFSIYPDGRIQMTDGAGTHEGRIKDWHHLDSEPDPEAVEGGEP